MTERRRWVALVISLIVLQTVVLWLIVNDDRDDDAERQSDLCTLVTEVLDNPSAPPPSPGSRGETQQRAIRQYEAKRC